MLDPLERDVANGKEAERLMSDETFKAACRRAEQLAVDEWKRTRPEDVALRESAYQLIRAIGRLEEALTAIKGDGDIAKRALTSLQGQQKQNQPRRQ